MPADAPTEPGSTPDRARAPAAGLVPARLAILVAYRDRAQHLRAFLPAMLAYFARDPAAAAIPCAIHVLEQVTPGLFNKGRLFNAGFRHLDGSADHVCLHDVDYVPLAADYGFTPRPALLVGEGFRGHGDAVAAREGRFFGAVVALSSADFVRVNGLSNGYWGWGYEDTELLIRCRAGGRDIDWRKGVFRALPHRSSQFEPNGHLKAATVANRERFMRRMFHLDDPATHAEDGLCNTPARIVATAPLRTKSPSRVAVWHHRIEVGAP